MYHRKPYNWRASDAMQIEVAKLYSIKLINMGVLLYQLYKLQSTSLSDLTPSKISDLATCNPLLLNPASRDSPCSTGKVCCDHTCALFGAPTISTNATLWPLEVGSSWSPNQTHKQVKHNGLWPMQKKWMGSNKIWPIYLAILFWNDVVSLSTKTYLNKNKNNCLLMLIVDICWTHTRAVWQAWEALQCPELGWNE